MTPTLIQRKLISEITANAPLAALLKGVFDFPPATPSFPFMTTGDIASQPFDTKGGKGMQHTVTMNVWSKTSRAEVRSVMDALQILLHDQDLPLGGGITIRCLLQRESSLVEPQSGTYRGVAVYQITAYPIL